MSSDSIMLSCFSAKKPCWGEYRAFNCRGNARSINRRAWFSRLSTEAGLHKSPMRALVVQRCGSAICLSSPVCTVFIKRNMYSAVPSDQNCAVPLRAKADPLMVAKVFLAYRSQNQKRKKGAAAGVAVDSNSAITRLYP